MVDEENSHNKGAFLYNLPIYYCKGMLIVIGKVNYIQREHLCTTYLYYDVTTNKELSMSGFKITTTENGKCDVTLTMFDKNNTIVGQKHSTYDVKPTIKELLDYSKTYKQNGAKTVRMTSTPSCSVKHYKL